MQSLALGRGQLIIGDVPAHAKRRTGIQTGREHAQQVRRRRWEGGKVRHLGEQPSAVDIGRDRLWLRPTAAAQIEEADQNRSEPAAGQSVGEGEGRPISVNGSHITVQLPFTAIVEQFAVELTDQLAVGASVHEQLIKQSGQPDKSCK